MKSINKYIFEKFRVNNDMGNISGDLNIKDYINASNFVILKFEDDYGFFEFNIYVIKKAKFQPIENENYNKLEGKDYFSKNRFDNDFILTTQISDGVMCAKYNNARYLIFPLKYFKENCEYDDLFMFFGESEYIDFDDMKKFIKIDAFNCLEKLYPMPPKQKKYKIRRSTQERFKIYSTIDSLEK